ncbi:MAG: cytochrome c biogenesis protein CcsA [Saprospiraceae bacterium]|nr:cytochrome c biogenesis protein CcsA [Saprospiraceae bacterium]MBK9728348.1 cytochrome c biogenesis protein CcsA [Saprospiraceae bacterium]
MTERHMWWKALGVILMLIVLTKGLLTPLKHGIVDIHPDRFNAGKEVRFEVTAYNSHYISHPDQINVYLKHVGDSKQKERSVDFILKSKLVKPLNENQIEVQFDLPAHLPDSRKLALFTVIVESPYDGAAAIPSKIIIQQDSINLENGIQAWSVTDKPNFHLPNKFDFPYRNILVETIRNTFFHVSLWFAMFLLFGMSVYYSIKFLRYNIPDADMRAFALVRTGLLFGILGCLTGSLWARYTWETWWTSDIKLNMAALTILIYLSYLVLRASIEDKDRKARISSAYNIFALVAVIPLIFVLPRLTDSLHPGNGGNPAIGADDMDNALRIIFYPAVLAFMLIGLWMASLLYRSDKISNFIEEKYNN